MLIAGVALGVATVVRLDGDPHRHPSGRERHDLRAQLDRPRDRRHARHRDLLDDRRRASGAILGPQAASGIGNAFLIAALVASLASVVALAVLPRAQHFLAKLALNPQAMPVH